MSGGTSGSWCPPPPGPRAHPQHAALAADARRPVLIASLDGLGAVDYVRAVHQDLGGGLHCGELWAKAGEREPSARGTPYTPGQDRTHWLRAGSGYGGGQRGTPGRARGQWRKGPRPRPGHAPVGVTSGLGFEALWTQVAGSSLRRELRAHWLAAHSRCTGTPRQPMNDSQRQGGGAPLGEGLLVVLELS